MSDFSKKILSFYNNHINEHGSGPRAMGWSDERSQLLRFAALCKVGDLEGSLVLDVGCGFGDLYRYLADHYERIGYTGIDINPRYIQRARELYPDAKFEVADFGEYAGGRFDFVVASGAFAVKIPNYKETYFKQIEKMFDIARKGIAFTMLDEKHHPNDETYAAYSPEGVKAFCMSLTNDIIIDHSYLPHDFTVVLKKEH